MIDFVKKYWMYLIYIFFIVLYIYFYSPVDDITPPEHILNIILITAIYFGIYFIYKLIVEVIKYYNKYEEEEDPEKKVAYYTLLEKNIIVLLICVVCLFMCGLILLSHLGKDFTKIRHYSYI